MKTFYHYHHRRIYTLIHSDFWNFEFSVWLHTIARSLIAIFVPILMLNFGYSLSAVLFYYLIFSLFDVPLNFLARRLTISFGARAVIIIATLVTIIYFVAFGKLAEGGLLMLVLLAFLDAVYDSFYWVSHMYLFFESTTEPGGRNTGIINGVRSFAGMLGPGVGALLLIVSGSGMLIWASIVFLGFSILPLINLRHVKNKPVETSLSFKSFFAELREQKDYLEIFLSSAVWNVENILWPLFIFSVFQTLDSIAAVAIIASVGQILFSYFAGLVSSKNGERFIIWGSVATIAVWVIRLAYPNEIFYYASILLTGFFAIMIGVPIESNIAERARTKNSLAAATLRNASTMIPGFLVFAVLIFLTEVFKVSFLMAILSLLILVVINRLFRARMKQSAKLITHSNL